MIELVRQVLVRTGDQILGVLPRLFASVLVFGAFAVAARLPRGVVRRLARGADPERARVWRLLGSALKAVLLVLGAITALGTLGVDVTALVAGLGLSGFALGFALRDAISNVLSGILILFYQPFRSGDRLKVGGCEGVVKEINLRYTVLQGEGVEYLVPNATCFTNWLALIRSGQ